MIVSMIAAAMMFCPTPHLIDKSGEAWNETDASSLKELAHDGCAKHNPKEPCLYELVKISHDEYSATCGPEQKRKVK